MKLHHSVLASFVLGALVAVGCDKPVENTGAPASPSGSVATTGSTEAPVKPGFKKGKHGFRGGGPHAIFFRAAHAQNLTDAQKTKLDEIAKGLKGDDATPRDELKKLHDELVAGVKAGKIDQAKVDAAQAEVDKAIKARREKDAEALNALHATLDAAQRKAVVAHVRERASKQAAKAEKWKDKAPKQPGVDGKAGPGGFMLKHLTADLGLDDAQQKKVEALLPKPADKPPFDPEAMKKRFDDMLTAFEGDAFDAKKLAGFDDKGPEPGKSPHGFMNAKFLSELLPILKPEQREKLAANMSKPMGHPGKKGPGPNAPSAPDGEGDDDEEP